MGISTFFSPVSIIFYYIEVVMLKNLGENSPYFVVAEVLVFVLTICRCEVKKKKQCSQNWTNRHLKDGIDDKCLLYFSLLFPLPYIFYFWKLRFDSSLEDLPKSGPHPPATPQVLTIGSQVAILSKVATTYSR